MLSAYGVHMKRQGLLGVAIGGMTGATSRWVVGEVITHQVAALLVVNILGSALLGAVVYGVLINKPILEIPIGIGFCGGFTTFSTFALEVAWRIEKGQVFDALCVVSLSLATGISAFTAGIATRRFIQ